MQPKPVPFRAHRYLQERGISYGELQEAKGRSATTWCRFLIGEREPVRGNARRDIEEVLRERGIPVPSDLWEAEAPAPAPSEPTTPEAQGEVQMQGHSLSDAALKAFRLFRSPFDPDAIVNPDGGHHLDDLYMPVSHQFIRMRLVQAFTKAGFVAVFGEPGSGKSTLLEAGFRDAAQLKPIVRVSPANVERRKMTAMHIGAELIRQLSEERIPRTANMRDHVAMEVLRQRYQQGQRVALVIDEAHELPDTTIKDLKRFHEMTDSYVRLLAIVLIGQTELAQRFELDRNHKLREVIIRCQLVHLPPLKEKGDVGRYMATRFRWVGAELADAWEPAAVEELENRLSIHTQQLPVLIGNVASLAMDLAYSRACARVTTDEVIDACTISASQRPAVRP